MMEPRLLGIVLAAAGAAGLLVSAFADPLGIGEGEVFGWLQTTGVILGAVVMLLGAVIAAEWVPLPGRARRGSGGSPQTTVIRDRDT